MSNAFQCPYFDFQSWSLMFDVLPQSLWIYCLAITCHQSTRQLLDKELLLKVSAPHRNMDFPKWLFWSPNFNVFFELPSWWTTLLSCRQEKELMQFMLLCMQFLILAPPFVCSVCWSSCFLFLPSLSLTNLWSYHSIKLFSSVCMC